MRLYVLTSEPDNFVPVEIKKAAEAGGLTAEIVDVERCVLSEGFIDDGMQKQAVSRIFQVSDGKIAEIKIDQQTVIIPRLNEHHLEIKLSMFKRMATQGAHLINSPESMELCNNKIMSQVLLNSAGIRTPFSFTITRDENLKVVIDAMEEGHYLKFPAIVKTLRGTHGIGVMRTDSKPSLISIVQTLIKEEIEFMIQEFIVHEQSCRIIMLGTDLLAANLRGQPENGEFRTNSHLGSETEPYTPSDVELTMARQIVGIFGANFCAIDYVIKKRADGTSELIVLEVNGSPGLENIQKNWPEKHLAGEVVKYVMTLLQDPGKNPEPAESSPPVETTESPESPPVPDEALPEPTLESPPVPDEALPEPTPDAVIQSIEPVVIHKIINEPIEARIDTGAKVSSIHVDKVEFVHNEKSVKFQRGDTSFTMPITRFVQIKNVHGGENARRAVVTLDATIGGKRVNGVEFNLNNRNNMKYQVLIGRNILAQLRIPVEVLPDDAPKDKPEGQKDVVEPDETDEVVVGPNGEEE